MTNTTNNKENWVKVKDFPRYSVSNTGLIRNDLTGKILKPYLIGSSYREAAQVQLQTDKRKKHYLVSHLVANHFLPIPTDPDKTFVKHLDGNRMNNSATNLIWATKAEIFNDPRTKLSFSQRPKKPAKPVLKLNPFTGEIISEYSSVTVAAEEHNLTPCAIRYTCQGKTRISGGFKWRYK